MAGNGNGDNWNAWSNHVLERLKNFKADSRDLEKKTSEEFRRVYDKVEKINLEVVSIKVKVALWGGVGAALATVLLQGAVILFKSQGSP